MQVCNYHYINYAKLKWIINQGRNLISWLSNKDLRRVYVCQNLYKSLLFWIMLQVNAPKVCKYAAALHFINSLSATTKQQLLVSTFANSHGIHIYKATHKYKTICLFMEIFTQLTDVLHYNFQAIFYTYLFCILIFLLHHKVNCTFFAFIAGFSFPLILYPLFYIFCKPWTFC